jgi:hypothetical protein
MKRITLTMALGAVSLSVFGQGTLDFANGAPGLNAPVMDSDGTKLSGSRWAADLYWAPGTVTDSTVLMALGAPASFSAMAPGYFFGGSRTIPGQGNGAVITAQIRVWDVTQGGTWPFVWAVPGGHVGESVLFQVTLTTPPNTPAILTGLNGHSFSAVPILIPEPSMLALGLSAMLIARLGKR